MKTWTGILQALARVGALAGGVVQAQVAPPDAEFAARLAAQLGADPAGIVMHATEGPLLLPRSREALFVRAARDVADTRAAVVALRPDGTQVDLDEALAVEADLARELGRRSVELDQRLAGLRPGERIPVAAWIAVPEDPEIQRSLVARLEALGSAATLDVVRSIRREAMAARRANAASRTGPVAVRLAAGGVVVERAALGAPLLYLSVDASALARLEADPDVLAIDLAELRHEPDLRVATSSVKARKVWKAPGGADGSGVRVAVVENGRVSPQQDWLSLAKSKSTSAAIDDHATAVASCAASFRPKWRGVAPGADILSACKFGWTDAATNLDTQLSGFADALDWAEEQDADVLNLSFGNPSPGSGLSIADKYLDSLASFGLTIVVSAGNSGGYVTDPRGGFNVISVGAYDDRGTAAWGDDVVCDWSSWKNPATGVEKPTVVAPGEDLTMLGLSGAELVIGSGTSFAAPLVAGTCALLMEQQPVLAALPATVRALLVAGAWHDVEDDGQLFSPRDGAGGISARAAWRAAVAGMGEGFHYAFVDDHDFGASGSYTALTPWLKKGETVRACLAWSSHVSDGSKAYSIDALKADLDLHVVGPDGTIATSISVLQPIELVEFKVPATGYYSLKVKRKSFDTPAELIGVAWSSRKDK